MADPGILSSQIPPGEDWLVRRVADLERAVREMRAADILRTAGLIAAPNLLTVVGGLVVSGSETVNGPLAVHGTAAFDGNTTIGGNAAITGTLSLPAGIINNAALASPVTADIKHADNNAFAVTTTRTTQATATFTVPAGFTQALIFAEGNASAVNTTGVVDTILVGAAVNGVEPPGWAASQDVAPAGLGGATRAVVKLLTGLTGGGTFTVSTRLYSGIAGWAGNSANICNIDATVLYLR